MTTHDARHEPNSELARRLNAIYQRNLERKDAARKEAKSEAKKSPKKSKKKAEPVSEEGHLDPNAPLNGVLSKGDNYSRRGYTYLKSQDGRGVYRNFSHAHLNEIREMVKERAEFPGGPKENFNPSFTQQFPYEWAAHHILPGSAFYYVLKDGQPAFTYKQIRLLLMSDYNINHGHNLIMLPREDWAVPVHSLICHPSDHEAYTLRIMEEMRKVAKRLQEVIDSGKPHGTLAESAFEALKKMEEQFWNLLTGISRRLVAAKVAGVRYVGRGSEHVRYENKSGTLYEWGSLW
ncbi:AHH domain-containing protein [Corallococcus sp. bb12-1]|uniref:AHH domain-containing protein n=1 Tax=Corallococcus sp. bb12-1 TaxID=2996784 RepID=UPI00226DE552|nr:AHH domain-containing protein [Corallococcus sp. bb12-1]MCY1042221.1 AHH domain-containing protein [Corallococcus sp. bb12-1]